MKSSQVILLVAAFLVGAGLVIGVGQLNKNDDSDLRAALAKAQEEIDALKKSAAGKPPAVPKLTSLPSAMPDKVEEVAVADEEEEPTTGEGEEAAADEDPAAAIAKLFNSKEARGFMKQMSAGFAKRGEAWIEQGVSEYTDKLNLSDAQVASLKKRLTAQMNEQMEAFNSKLDDENLSMQEIMQEQREVMQGQEDVMAEILKEELNEEQFAEFEREQLIEKTERVQRDSDRELSRLDRDLELTESQEDQVFGILVKTNSDYDESMAIEGADPSVVVSEDTAKEDAIRSVLDAEQSAKYDESLERQENQRRNPFGGGFRGFGR